MKLLFDARYIRTDFHDGISRYSAELGSALSRLTPVTFLICNLKQLQLLPPKSRYILIHKPTSALEPFTALRLNHYQPNIVFSPMQTMGSIGRQYKLILTSHDMIYYRHKTPPPQFNPAIRLGWRLYHSSYLFERTALNRADIVVTVSQTVKQEFLAAHLTNRPIEVIANAPQDLRHYLDEKPTATPVRNLVYMGSFVPYKNVETLILGMQYLPGYRLHLLSPVSAEREQALRRLIPQTGNVQFHHGVSDNMYAHILANQALLVSASLDEGYGLPVAEALALGVPAVLSDIPIFHEVGDRGATYFDPHDPEAFAQAVKKASQPTTYQQLSIAGQRHIQQYSWKASAKRLLSCMNQLIAKA